MRDSIEEILKNARPAVLVGQTTPTGNAATTNKPGVSNSGAGPAANAFNKINAGTVTTVKNPQSSIQYFGNGNIGVSALSGAGGTSKPKSGSGSGSGGTSSIVPDYKASLDDLYNKVMGYGGYSYTPYTPGTYNPTIDTSGTQAALKSALGDIQGYGDFQYDLNGDLLYQQAVDNYAMLGQQAMMDATANAAALTGGYGNSYAASAGNQAYQNYITQANNMIPQFQQMAMNVWQSGLDRRMNVYDAVSQQLANELSLEDMAFAIWAQNEANAANAHSMNSQNAFNAWSAGLDQLLGQYDVTKDYYATLEAMNKASSSGGSSESSRNDNSWVNDFTPGITAETLKAGLQNMNSGLESPYTSAQLIELIKQNQKK